jgi:hypothetical protein
MAWTAGAVVERRPVVSRRVRFAGAATLAVVALTGTAALTTDAAKVEPDDVATSRALRALTPQVIAAIDEAGTGRPGGRYLITWTDPIGVTGELQGFGLVNELDRRGIMVGLEPKRWLRASPYLTLQRQDATAVVHLATGRAVDSWDAKPGVRRIAEYDPRTAEQRDRQQRLREELHDGLRDLGRPELVDRIESSFVGYVFVLREDPGIPQRLIDVMMEIIELGTPTTLFLETGGPGEQVGRAAPDRSPTPVAPPSTPPR